MSIDEPTSEAPLPSLLDPVILDDPFDTYAEMHSRCPVHKLPENDLYVVAPHEEVRRVLNDTETFSSRNAAVNAAVCSCQLGLPRQDHDYHRRHP
jgi:cytochrome P450